jgi:hypothetical protein
VGHVTQNLATIEDGDIHAPDEFLPLVYDELRQLAAQGFAVPHACRSAATISVRAAR